MDRKTAKPVLEDETLDRVVGGAGGNISYTIMELNEKKEADRAKINYLMNGVCPNYSMLEHTRMLEKISDTEFNCDCCGYKWIIKTRK